VSGGRSGIGAEDRAERSAAVSGRVRKPRSGSGERSGKVMVRERSGEWTKLGAQILLKGDASLLKLPITLDSGTNTTQLLTD